MQNSISFERERLRLLNLEGAASQTDSTTSIDNKIEALKALTQALLKELESLTKVSGLENGQEVTLSDEVRRFEADLIRSALIRTGGRQRRAARLLNMKVATLNAKIKRYHLDADELIITATNMRQHIK